MAVAKGVPSFMVGVKGNGISVGADGKLSTTTSLTITRSAGENAGKGYDFGTITRDQGGVIAGCEFTSEISHMTAAERVQVFKALNIDSDTGRLNFKDGNDMLSLLKQAYEIVGLDISNRGTIIHLGPSSQITLTVGGQIQNASLPGVPSLAPAKIKALAAFLAAGGMEVSEGQLTVAVAKWIIMSNKSEKKGMQTVVCGFERNAGGEGGFKLFQDFRQEFEGAGSIGIRAYSEFATTGEGKEKKTTLILNPAGFSFSGNLSALSKGQITALFGEIDGLGLAPAGVDNQKVLGSFDAALARGKTAKGILSSFVIAMKDKGPFASSTYHLEDGSAFTLEESINNLRGTDKQEINVLFHTQDGMPTFGMRKAMEKLGLGISVQQLEYALRRSGGNRVGILTLHGMDQTFLKFTEGEGDKEIDIFISANGSLYAPVGTEGALALVFDMETGAAPAVEGLPKTLGAIARSLEVAWLAVSESGKSGDKVSLSGFVIRWDEKAGKLTCDVIADLGHGEQVMNIDLLAGYLANTTTPPPAQGSSKTTEPPADVKTAAKIEGTPEHMSALFGENYADSGKVAKSIPPESKKPQLTLVANQSANFFDAFMEEFKGREKKLSAGEYQFHCYQLSDDELVKFCADNNVRIIDFFATLNRADIYLQGTDGEFYDGQGKVFKGGGQLIAEFATTGLCAYYMDSGKKLWVYDCKTQQFTDEFATVPNWAANDNKKARLLTGGYIAGLARFFNQHGLSEKQAWGEIHFMRDNFGITWTDEKGDIFDKLFNRSLIVLEDGRTGVFTVTGQIDPATGKGWNWAQIYGGKTYAGLGGDMVDIQTLLLDSQYKDMALAILGNEKLMVQILLRKTGSKWLQQGQLRKASKEIVKYLNFDDSYIPSEYYYSTEKGRPVIATKAVNILSRGPAGYKDENKTINDLLYYNKSIIEWDDGKTGVLVMTGQGDPKTGSYNWAQHEDGIMYVGVSSNMINLEKFLTDPQYTNLALKMLKDEKNMVYAVIRVCGSLLLKKGQLEGIPEKIKRYLDYDVSYLPEHFTFGIEDGRTVILSLEVNP